MSLNLTYADNADAARRARRQRTAKIVAALTIALLVAAAIGLLISPYPIHAY